MSSKFSQATEVNSLLDVDNLNFPHCLSSQHLKVQTLESDRGNQELEDKLLHEGQEAHLFPTWHLLSHGLFSDLPGLFYFVRSHLPLWMSMRILEGKLDDEEKIK